MKQPTHSIRTVARRTGLSPHVIRIWEKRYQAVEPDRSDTNRRLYTECDVERLGLLHEATLAGHSIGLIARLSNGQLRKLISAGAHAAPNHVSKCTDPEACRGHCIAAIRDLDEVELDRLLRAAALQSGVQGVLQKLIAPLAEDLGNLWQAGEITAAHEHFASAVIRTFLANLAKPFALTEAAPVLVVATPAGQIHELGAVLVAAAGTSHGWRVSYLGASLPAAEIAGVALRLQARAVALSLVYPKDDAHLPHELEQLRAFLPAHTSILAGGRAASAYRAALERIGARAAGSLDELYALLDQIRSETVSPPGVNGH